MIWSAGNSGAIVRKKESRADSKTETFAALRLEVDSWRWKGVPFYIRAGKNLPVTCTEVFARLRNPPIGFRDGDRPETTCVSASVLK